MRAHFVLRVLFGVFFFAVEPAESAVPKKSGTTKKASTTKTTTKPPAKKPSSTGETEPAKSPAKPPEKAPEPPPAPPAPPPAPEIKPERAPNATIEPADLMEFDQQPPRVQRLIEAALALTKQNLTYAYGSADPARGGMDCSGTISYTLRAQGFADVPRDSSGQYVWVRKAGGFEAVISTSADSFEFNALQPGDLMFWSGTYSVQREIPITHVMMYLGREKKTKQRVMFGASDGRSYKGIQRWGVSVFDFKMPKVDSSRDRAPNFLGYGPIPGLRGEQVLAAVAQGVTETKKEEEEPPGKPAAAKPATKSTKSKPAATSGKKKRSN